MWTERRTDGRKTGRLYRTLLKQVRQKPKMTKLNGHNSVKYTSSFIEHPYARFHYVHKKYATFQKDPLKTRGAVDHQYTKSILDTVKNAKNVRPEAKCPPMFEMSICGEYVYHI